MDEDYQGKLEQRAGLTLSNPASYNAEGFCLEARFDICFN
jgi:hypothetical protein